MERDPSSSFLWPVGVNLQEVFLFKDALDVIEVSGFRCGDWTRDGAPG